MTKANARFVIRRLNHEKVVSTAAELERHIAEACARSFNDLWLVRAGHSLRGLERFLYRLLGLRTDTDGPSAHVLTAPEGAAVAVFLDEDFNEYTLLASETSRVVERAVTFELSSGEKSQYLPEEVVSADAAFAALRYFFACNGDQFRSDRHGGVVAQYDPRLVVVLS